MGLGYRIVRNLVVREQLLVGIEVELREMDGKKGCTMDRRRCYQHHLFLKILKQNIISNQIHYLKSAVYHLLDVKFQRLIDLGPLIKSILFSKN